MSKINNLVEVRIGCVCCVVPSAFPEISTASASAPIAPKWSVSATVNMSNYTTPPLVRNRTYRVDSLVAGSKVWESRLCRHFANGVAWDPHNKYIVTASTDRKLDILDAVKGTRVRTCDKVILPTTVLDDSTTIIQTNAKKIFHDDQLPAFIRGVEFSPCGSLLFAPCQLWKEGVHYIFQVQIGRAHV